MQGDTVKVLRQYGGLLMAGAVSLAAYLGLVQLHWQSGSLTFAQVPATLGWYTLVFAAFIGAIVWVERHGGLSLTLIFGAPLLFRVLLLCTTPTLSGDVYRYIWDGYIANQGISPYAFPADSPTLDPLEIPLRNSIDHAWMASPYLPVAQNLFVALTRFLPSQPLLFQAAMVTFDMLSGLLLIQLLRLAHLPDHRSVLYLWNPLVILESAHGAHVDSWMIVLVLLALWLTFTERLPHFSSWLGPVVLALATLTKGLPILLLPILFWRWRWWQFLLFGGTLLLWLVPAALNAGWGLSGPLDGTGVFGAIRIFADRWNFNSGLFHWLEVGLLDMGVIEANRWAKRAITVAMLLALTGIWLAARRRTPIWATLRLMIWPYVACILLIPTVHPWYLLIMVVFLPFLPPTEQESPSMWLAAIPWLYLSWAVTLSYWTYINPQDLREFTWVRNTEWLPTLFMVGIWGVWQVIRQLRLRKGAAHH